MNDALQKYLQIKVSINGNELDTYSFDSSRVNIGRGSDCHVVLDNPGISRIHAIIEREGDNLQITDLDSGNGTFVNGNSVKKASLRSGDTVRVGKFTLVIRLSVLDSRTAEPSTPNASSVSPELEEQTVTLNAADRQKILQQAQSFQANKPKATKGFDKSTVALLFVAGTVFGLFVSWLIQG